ncbi:MAG: PP2C family protein-serine/threonine phosphatase, partial [Planctomycetota bacterium]
MKKKHQTSLYTGEFRSEFEADTTALLGRRLSSFLKLWGWVAVALFLLRWGGSLLMRHDLLPARVPFLGTPLDWTLTQWIVSLVADAVVLILYGSIWAVVRNVRIPRSRLLTISIMLIIAEGAIRVLAAGVVPDSWPVWKVMLTHAVAAGFLPWSPLQALRSMLAVAILNAAVQVIAGSHLGAPEWLAIALTPLAAAPGTGIAWLKHTRRLDQYKITMLSRRYGEFRRELLDARKIHEAIFPQAITSGPVRFWYEYEPMRAIGGDFVFAQSCPHQQGRVLNVVLVDVTGHGISAALTVNRLHGELERVYAENPDAEPGEVLSLLNRYIHLTLAKHSVFATALCFRVNCDSDSIDFASAGHPPAFIRAIDGTVHDMESTSILLGVSPHAEFDPAQQSIKFGPGDALLAFTDGAMEARDQAGKMLGTKG